MASLEILGFLFLVSEASKTANLSSEKEQLCGIKCWVVFPKSWKNEKQTNKKARYISDYIEECHFPVSILFWEIHILRCYAWDADSLAEYNSVTLNLSECRVSERAAVTLEGPLPGSPPKQCNQAGCFPERSPSSLKIPSKKGAFAFILKSKKTSSDIIFLRHLFKRFIRPGVNQNLSCSLILLLIVPRAWKINYYFPLASAIHIWEDLSPIHFFSQNPHFSRLLIISFSLLFN